MTTEQNLNSALSESSVSAESVRKGGILMLKGAGGSNAVAVVCVICCWSLPLFCALTRRSRLC